MAHIIICPSQCYLFWPAVGYWEERVIPTLVEDMIWLEDEDEV